MLILSGLSVLKNYLRGGDEINSYYNTDSGSNKKYPVMQNSGKNSSGSIPEYNSLRSLKKMLYGYPV
jgi:hypothetical protein